MIGREQQQKIEAHVAAIRYALTETFREEDDWRDASGEALESLDALAARLSGLQAQAERNWIFARKEAERAEAAEARLSGLQDTLAEERRRAIRAEAELYLYRLWADSAAYEGRLAEAVCDYLDRRKLGNHVIGPEVGKVLDAEDGAAALDAALSLNTDGPKGVTCDEDCACGDPTKCGTADPETLSVCPKCEALVEDLDGFGVLFHDGCGYCSHPDVYDGACRACGAALNGDGEATE